ncbi:MAG: cytochrome c [Sphingomonadales bacterium]|jgi:mono/diheme cytochrome c family protein|nr:cytochrome c [Sphingomonadales bacterium]
MKRILFLLTALSASTPLLAADGATLYKRCAACHLPTGAGVPGAYPALSNDFLTLAKKPAGRRYLALVVIKGVSGPITVGGKPFRGVMPAQMLNDADTAAVLNHVGTVVAKGGKGFKAFTEAEVKAARASGAALSAAQIGALHAASGGK